MISLPWIAGLGEGVDRHTEAGVLPHQPGGVLLRQEGVHEDEGHVGVVGPVQVLDLLDCQVQGGQIVSHGDCAGGTTEQIVIIKIIIDKIVKIANHLHPKAVARAPLSLTTTSWSSIALNGDFQSFVYDLCDL